MGKLAQGQDRSSWEQRAIDRSLQRAQERAATRPLAAAREIVAAGMDLLHETGGFDFTVKQVSVRAGVALQTVYRHFDTKDRLVLAVLEESVRAGAEAIAKQSAAVSDPLEKVRAVVTGPSRLLSPGVIGQSEAAVVREHLRLQVNFASEIDVITAPYRELLLEVLESASAAGQLHLVNPEADARILQHLVMSYFHQFALKAIPGDAVETGDYLWGFCRAALDRGRTVAARPAASKSSRKR